MKVDSYKPIGNRVLIKHVYEVPALAMPKIKESFSLYLKDRVIVRGYPKMTDDYPELVEGVCVHTNPNAMDAQPVFFADNKNDVNTIYKQYQAEARKNPNIIGTYTMIGYFTMPVYDIYAVVNPTCEDPKPDDAKPMIVIN